MGRYIGNSKFKLALWLPNFPESGPVFVSKDEGIVALPLIAAKASVKVYLRACRSNILGAK
jgi:hypothetical protein